MNENPAAALEAIRRRDPEALAALVRAHHRRLRGFVAVVSGDLQAVDDLAQEVFLRAFSLLNQVTDLEGFDRFLRGIARNVVREHARKRGVHLEPYERFIDSLAATGAPSPVVEDSDLVKTLRGCLEKLPGRSRHMLDLRYTQERAAEEIGQEMGLNTGTVRVTLLRIREALLKCMRSGAGMEAAEARP